MGKKQEKRVFIEARSVERHGSLEAERTVRASVEGADAVADAVEIVQAAAKAWDPSATFSD